MKNTENRDIYIISPHIYPEEGNYAVQNLFLLDFLNKNSREKYFIIAPKFNQISKFNVIDKIYKKNINNIININLFFLYGNSYFSKVLNKIEFYIKTIIYLKFKKFKKIIIQCPFLPLFFLFRIVFSKKILILDVKDIINNYFSGRVKNIVKNLEIRAINYSDFVIINNPNYIRVINNVKYQVIPDFYPNFNFLKKFQSRSFDFLYSGNFGKAIDFFGFLNFINEYSSSFFKIHVKGLLVDQLNDFIKKNNHNIYVKKLLPLKIYLELLSSAKYSLVSLNKKSMHSSTQGKIIASLSCGTPLIFIGPECHLSKIITNNKLGYHFNDEFKKSIKSDSLLNNQNIWNDLSMNCIKYYKNNFSLEIIGPRYLNFIQS